MSELLFRVGIALLAWAFALFLCNPYLEGKRRTVAMTGCAIAGTVCLVFS